VESNKLIVRNVAFQASKAEIRDLFAVYGAVKRVRIPKKMGGEHRGFAFVDFSTAQEAAQAMAALKNTHLYGRHLVLEWADEETHAGAGLGGSGMGKGMVSGTVMGMGSGMGAGAGKPAVKRTADEQTLEAHRVAKRTKSKGVLG
jgi:RNA recognition motif-containing protein